MHRISITAVALISVTCIFSCKQKQAAVSSVLPPQDSSWKAPKLEDDKSLTNEDLQLVSYGADIIANTSKYYGPKGTIAQQSNGMNCQNCHLDKGTRAWGNNYSAVFSTYPKFRERSGAVESIYKRVNDCFERSLNGKSIDSNSHEFKAIYAYMKWLGKGVPKDVKPRGAGIEKSSFIERAADTAKGQVLFAAKCVTCHQKDGQGFINQEQTGYIYPPLWGEHSYTTGAGLYRISNLAGFVKSNMPFNEATHIKPVLTNEEAWDVAAYINSKPRPAYNQRHDWPNISAKPFDFPFGPYTDSFTATQHKYGPFAPIVAAKETAKKLAKNG